MVARLQEPRSSLSQLVWDTICRRRIVSRMRSWVFYLWVHLWLSMLTDGRQRRRTSLRPPPRRSMTRRLMSRKKLTRRLIVKPCLKTRLRRRPKRRRTRNLSRLLETRLVIDDEDEAKIIAAEQPKSQEELEAQIQASAADRREFKAIDAFPDKKVRVTITPHFCRRVKDILLEQALLYRIRDLSTRSNTAWPAAGQTQNAKEDEETLREREVSSGERLAERARASSISRWTV